MAGETVVAVHPLAEGRPPAWARAWGQDRQGVFAAFEVAGVRQRLRWLPPGRFRMGVGHGSLGDSSGAMFHEVRLRYGCWIGEGLCRGGLYRAVMGESPTTPGDEPVSRVSWGDVEQFFARLNAIVPQLRARLPTEAEWERALQLVAGRSTLSEVWTASLFHRLFGRSTARSALTESGLGVLEMGLAYQEWCGDWYAPFTRESVVDPAGPAQGTDRVVRGVGRGRVVTLLSLASRDSRLPGVRDAAVSFRIAVPLAPEDVLMRPRSVVRTVPAVPRPAWADGFGVDAYGTWAEFKLAGVPVRMRWIPPGKFLMGSPPEEKDRESDELQHEVTLTRGYWLAATTCTNELWAAVVDKGAAKAEEPRHPVVGVSFDDVQGFLREAAKSAAGRGLRLPTEAEWEYACRAGTTSAFSFGDRIEKGQVNFMSSGTVEVGTLPPNAWGLHEMHGNVWEWCADWYGAYEGKPASDPIGPRKGRDRVLRGGSFSRGAVDCRAARRLAPPPPPTTGPSPGFRLARGQD